MTQIVIAPSLDRRRLAYEVARMRDLDDFDRAINRPPRSFADEVGRHLHRARRRGCYVRSHHGLLMGGGGVSPGDPSWSSVSLLLPFNGSNGGTSFPDSSSFVSNHTIALFGANAVTTTSTAQSKWGGSSYLSTSTAGGVTVTVGTGGPANEFSYPGDASFETWIRWTNSGSQYVFDHGTNSSTFIIVPSSGNVQWYLGGHIINTGSTPFSTGTWYFLQLVRSGSTWTVGRDGSSYATGTSSSTFGFVNSTGGRVLVGNYGGGGIATVGHMQDFRITKGVARALAVPTAAFPTH